MEEIGIESTTLELIKNGEKTIEGRLGKPRFLKIREGDVLSLREDFWYEGKILESLSHALEVKVTQVLYFETFEEMLNAVDFQAAVPTANSVEEGVKRYREFYSSEDEHEYGVVAFMLEVVRA